MRYERDGGGESQALSPEMRIFAGRFPDRRSHQLRLVEYSQPRPGRLASRLPMKMQALLARDAGTPFPRSLDGEHDSKHRHGIPAHDPDPDLQGQDGGAPSEGIIRTVSAALDGIAVDGRRPAGAESEGPRTAAGRQWMAKGPVSGVDRSRGRGSRRTGRTKAAAGAGHPEGKGKGDRRGKGRGEKGGKRGDWAAQAHDAKDKPPPPDGAIWCGW